MRFETTELTLIIPSWSGGDEWFFADTTRDHNFACYDTLSKYYHLPRKVGTRIVLVFSTKRVRNAPDCPVNALFYAGDLALQKVMNRSIGGWIMRDGTWLYLYDDDRLWWWPEIIS